jgi:hypothetical protein
MFTNLFMFINRDADSRMKQLQNTLSQRETEIEALKKKISEYEQEIGV